MTFRERVEALPIRPIGHISHGANPSLKIHLLPKAGTDRNVRSSEYLAEPAVDQCMVGQCSLFLAFFKLFFHVAVRDLPIIVRDKEGKPYSVRYDQVNAMLLNEFLKAHQKLEEQGATIAKQQKQIEALTAGLQKVSAQMELSKPVRQMLMNDQ